MVRQQHVHRPRLARRARAVWAALLCTALVLQLGRGQACSFLVTNRPDVPLPTHADEFADPAHWNYFMKMRGPVQTI